MFFLISLLASKLFFDLFVDQTIFLLVEIVPFFSFCVFSSVCFLHQLLLESTCNNFYEFYEQIKDICRITSK